MQNITLLLSILKKMQFNIQSYTDTTHLHFVMHMQFMH